MEGILQNWSVEARLARVASLGLTGLASLALLMGLATATLRLDDLGLAGGLPPLYWVGLVGLPMASIIEARSGERASRWLMLLHVGIWVLVVWATPLILEGTPRFRTSYANYGDVDPLVRAVGLDRDAFLYHNWPLFPILMSVPVQLGVSPELLMGLFPVVILPVYLVLGTFLIRALSDPELDRDGWHPRAIIDWTRRAPPSWVLALWLMPIFNWTGQDYFSPQAFAYGLFLVFLLPLASAARRSDRRLGPIGAGVALIALAAIVATHVLTSLVSLAILGILVLIRLVRPWSMLLAGLAIFFAWQAWFAAPFYTWYGDRLLEGMLRATQFFESNVVERVGGSPGHELVVYIRILVTLALFAAAALAGAIVFRQRLRARALWFVVAYLLGVGLVIPISIYGGEALIRGLLFGLPVALLVFAYAAARSTVVWALLAVLLVVNAPLHIFTHYGNELYDYVSPAELEGLDRAAELAPANIYGGFPAGRYQRTAELDSRNASLPRGGHVTTLQDYLDPLDHNWANENLPLYVMLTRGDAAALRLFRNDTTLVPLAREVLDAHEAFTEVFRNEDVVIYRWEAEEP